MYNRTQPLSYMIYAGVFGTVFGYLLQLLLTSSGYGVFVPLWLQGAFLLVIGGVVLVFAWLLRKEIEQKRTVQDPLKAVRILAAARACQLLGAAFAGFGLGLFVWIAPRLPGTALTVWAPMLLLAICGVLLALMGVFAERFCRVPPGEHGEEGGDEPRGGTARGELKPATFQDFS